MQGKQHDSAWSRPKLGKNNSEIIWSISNVQSIVNRKNNLMIDPSYKEEKSEDRASSQSCHTNFRIAELFAPNSGADTGFFLKFAMN